MPPPDELPHYLVFVFGPAFKRTEEQKLLTYLTRARDVGRCIFHTWVRKRFKYVGDLKRRAVVPDSARFVPEFAAILFGMALETVSADANPAWGHSRVIILVAPPGFFADETLSSISCELAGLMDHIKTVREFKEFITCLIQTYPQT